jgi:hypothetical protein
VRQSASDRAQLSPGVARLRDVNEVVAAQQLGVLAQVWRVKDGERRAAGRAAQIARSAGRPAVDTAGVPSTSFITWAALATTSACSSASSQCCRLAHVSKTRTGIGVLLVAMHEPQLTALRLGQQRARAQQPVGEDVALPRERAKLGGAGQWP